MAILQGLGWRRSNRRQSERAGDTENRAEADAAAAGTGHIIRPVTEPTFLRFESNFLIAQYVIGALLSVPVLVSGFLISRINRHNGEECASFMHRPIITIAVLLLFISLAGLTAAIIDRLRESPTEILAWFHLLLMFFLVILLFCFCIFSLEVTNQNLAHSVTGYGQTYKEYRLFEYPKWMRHRVESVKWWRNVRSCLQSSPVCSSEDIPDFLSNITYTNIEDLTPIQKGCCIPPSACKISFTGARSGLNEAHKVTTDMKNENMRERKEKLFGTTMHAYIHDCVRWNSNPYQLCYDCDTCKAGVIQANMDTWRKPGILYVILVMIMIFTYACFACFGFVQEKDI